MIQSKAKKKYLHLISLLQKQVLNISNTIKYVEDLRKVEIISNSNIKFSWAELRIEVTELFSWAELRNRSRLQISGDLENKSNS